MDEVVDSLRRDLTVPEAHAATAKPLGTEPVADRSKWPKHYNTDGTYCREFQQNVTIGGVVQASYGRACLQNDGSWKIVK